MFKSVPLHWVVHLVHSHGNDEVKLCDRHRRIVKDVNGV